MNIKEQHRLSLPQPSWKIFLLSLLFSGLAVHTLVLASIDLQNANYADTWTDFEDATINLQRTYNSRSGYDGLFGFGWCSDIETRLQIGDKESDPLTVINCGDGLKRQLLPESGPQTELHSYRSVDGMYMINKLGNGDYVLSENREDEQMRRMQFDATGKLVGTNDMSRSRMRKLEEDSTVNRQAPWITLEYHDERPIRLSFVQDSTTTEYVLDYFSNGKVKRIQRDGEVISAYRYSPFGDLIWVQNNWENEYSYQYDMLHNLIFVGYPDGTSKSIQYDQDNDWAIGFKWLNGCVERYRYNSRDMNRYVSQLEKNCNGVIVAKHFSEFVWKQRSDSTKFLYKTRRVLDRQYELVIFDSQTEMPEKRLTRTHQSTFHYNKSGALDYIEALDIRTGDIRRTEYSLDGAGRYHPSLPFLQPKVQTEGEDTCYDCKFKIQ